MKKPLSYKQQIRENERLREELTPQLNEQKSEINQREARIQYIEKQIDDWCGPLPRGAFRRGGSLTKEARKAMDDEIADLKDQLKDLYREYKPLEKQVERLQAEYRKLLDNPPKVSTRDLKAKQAQQTKVDAEIARISQAAEEAASRTQTDAINELRQQIESEAADRDLLAADVDMGQGSAAELKKISTNITKLKKQLAELEEAASLTEATRRGYSRRLDGLQEQRDEISHELRELVSLYAQAIHEQEVEQIRGALSVIETALTGIAAAQKLSETHGDRSEFSRLAGRARLEFSGINELSESAVEASEESIAERLETMLKGFQKG